ncbi:MAG: electron transfer flavoprotein subunit alpha/FixB family protein [Deltaproteobacteria bacterium]|nr:electron transfer flavoprotein subunit alpha/FixB family protein [Deltaproteobacteria bacterium]
MSNVLILVEQLKGAPKKTSLNGITFGQQLVAKSGGELHLAVIGKDANQVATQLRSYGAAKIHVITGEAFAAPVVETLTAALATAAQACSANIIAAASSSTIKDVLPRLAARLDAAMASDVIEVVDDSTFKRPMWAGNVTATVRLTTPMRICSVRSTEFDEPENKGGESAIAEINFELDLSAIKTKLVNFKEIKSQRPDVTTANIVVSGGRGVKNPEGFAIVEQLADTLGAGVGATRAVVDAGWVPNDLQVGQTGKIVAPNLYIAVGISGAIQHLAGMKGSKTIVAINKDPEAPIFQIADYGLVADMQKAVPELINAIKSMRA